jgi:hypothetical protein
MGVLIGRTSEPACGRSPTSTVPGRMAQRVDTRVVGAGDAGASAVLA